MAAKYNRMYVRISALGFMFRVFYEIQFCEHFFRIMGRTLHTEPHSNLVCIHTVSNRVYSTYGIPYMYAE